MDREERFSDEKLDGIVAMMREHDRNPNTILQVLKLHPAAKLPTRSTERSACWDVYALNDAVVVPGSVVAVPTGLRLIIPRGFRVDVKSRSGLSLKEGVIVLNAPGTIDEDYAGELLIIMTKVKGGPAAGMPAVVSFFASYHVEAGDRIAQISLERVIEFQVEEIQEIPEGFLDRGGGLGSTGR